MSVQIQLRHDTAANWTSANPTMAAGECGVETDTHKFKTGDGATAWNSLAYVGTATTPGGSDTQIQYNNAGAFGGDANLTWNNTDGHLSMKAVTDGNAFEVFDYNSNRLFYCQINAPSPYVAFGDTNLAYNKTLFYVDDGNLIVEFNAPLGRCQLGDWEGTGNTSQVLVDDANQKTTSNVKHEASGNVTVMTNGQGLHQQSPNGHYWRLDISNAGAASWTDIGTSPP